MLVRARRRALALRVTERAFLALRPAAGRDTRRAFGATLRELAFLRLFLAVLRLGAALLGRRALDALGLRRALAFLVARPRVAADLLGERLLLLVERLALLRP
jgi:hypothetical protein